MDYVIPKRLRLLSENLSARHMILPYKLLVGEITEIPLAVRGPSKLNSKLFLKKSPQTWAVGHRKFKVASFLILSVAMQAAARVKVSMILFALNSECYNIGHQGRLYRVE